MTANSSLINVFLGLFLSSLISTVAYGECFSGDNGQLVCEGDVAPSEPVRMDNGALIDAAFKNIKIDQNPASYPSVFGNSLGGGTTTETAPTAGTTTNKSNLVDQCTQDTKDAVAYCEDPLSASTGGGIQGGAETAGIATNLLGIAGMYNAATGGSSEAICNLMKTGGAAGLGLNGTFAARCGALISDCEKSCGDALDVYKNDTELSSKRRLCSSQRNRAAQMTGAASQSFNAALMGRACQTAAQTSSLATTMAPPEMPVVGTNCALDPTNPVCQSTGTGGNTTYGSSSGAMDGKGSDDFNVGVDGSGDPSQTGNPGGSGSTEAIKNSGVSNGGGSMLGGGSGSGGGGGDDKGGRGGGPGYKTDVLQGERAGGGYAQGGAPSASGGWSGYGAGSEEKQKSAGLDLRKFLPGQQNAPLRGPAGLNRANAELAAMHEDIFKKISDRVLVVCKTNRLKDCK